MLEKLGVGVAGHNHRKNRHIHDTVLDDGVVTPDEGIDGGEADIVLRQGELHINLEEAAEVGAFFVPDKGVERITLVDAFHLDLTFLGSVHNLLDFGSGLGLGELLLFFFGKFNLVDGLCAGAVVGELIGADANEVFFFGDFVEEVDHLKRVGVRLVVRVDFAALGSVADCGTEFVLEGEELLLAERGLVHFDELLVASGVQDIFHGVVVELVGENVGDTVESLVVARLTLVKRTDGGARHGVELGDGGRKLNLVVFVDCGNVDVVRSGVDVHGELTVSFALALKGSSTSIFGDTALPLNTDSIIGL